MIPDRTLVNAEILDRMPPSHPNVEAQIIGAILLFPRTIDEIASIVRPEDFYVDAHQRIYRTLVAMLDEGNQIDHVLLVNRLERAGELEAIGGHAYIAELAQSVAVYHHAKYHAKIVVDDSRRRQMLLAAVDLYQDARNVQMDAENILGKAEGALSSIRTGTYDTDPVPMFDATIAAMQKIDDIAERGKHAGYLIGMEEYDRIVGGVFRSELTLIAARPSHGKTSLALQWAGHLAERGRRVYFATLEMSHVEMAAKRLCSVAKVNSQRLRVGGLTPEERQRIASVANRVGVKNMVLHDWPEIRPFDIQRAAKRFDAEVVFVDYLQYVTPPDPKKKRYEQVGEISKALKTMSRRLDIPVVACVQIGREAEKTAKDTRPRILNLRESGNIEADADVIAMLWKPENGITLQGDKWDAELIVGKNRNGMTATLRLNWDGGLTCFSCYGGDWCNEEPDDDVDPTVGKEWAPPQGDLF